jgi:RES domain-containing protein
MTPCLPENWSTLNPREQSKTRSLGDEWVKQQRSAILGVPSVVAGERNYVLNPGHPDFSRIGFTDPIPFHFDTRLFRSREQVVGSERSAAQ